jgi:hypothetical protein
MRLLINLVQVNLKGSDSLLDINTVKAFNAAVDERLKSAFDPLKDMIGEYPIEQNPKSVKTLAEKLKEKIEKQTNSDLKETITSEIQSLEETHPQSMPILHAVGKVYVNEARKKLLYLEKDAKYQDDILKRFIEKTKAWIHLSAKDMLDLFDEYIKSCDRHSSAEKCEKKWNELQERNKKIENHKMKAMCAELTELSCTIQFHDILENVKELLQAVLKQVFDANVSEKTKKADGIPDLFSEAQNQANQFVRVNNNDQKRLIEAVEMIGEMYLNA